MAGTIGEGPKPDQSAEKRREIPYLGAVKIAAVVMGIMIVVGVAVIGVTIAKRLAGDGEAPSARPDSPAPTVPRSFADRDITIPEGAAVVDTTVNGRRLAISLRLRDGRSAVLLVDAETGDRLGLLTLTPATP